MLTARQRELLTLVAEGMSNRDIAAALVLSEGTVRRHLDNIYLRLSVRTARPPLLRCSTSTKPRVPSQAGEWRIYLATRSACDTRRPTAATGTATNKSGA